MNKSQIIAALIAAGVSEANESMTVDQLKALAAERGVSLTPPSKPLSVEESPGSELERFNELVAEKIAAGLPADTAAECAKRQLEREAENAKKQP